MNIKDAKAKLEDANERLKAVRDDIHALAKDLEDVPEELKAEIKSTGDHVHNALMLVAVMVEGLASL